MIKRILKILLAIPLLLILLVLGFALWFFFSPTTFINPETIEWGLNKAGIFQEWSWKSAKVEHDLESWNHRRFRGDFDDLCIHFNRETIEVKSCLEISWDIELNFSLSGAFDQKTHLPLTIKSSDMIIKTKELMGPPEPEEESGPPDIKGYWSYLWYSFIPEILVDIKPLRISLAEKDLDLSFLLEKTFKKLLVRVDEFELTGTPDKIILKGPEAYKIPLEKEMPIPLILRNFNLSILMNEADLPIQTTGVVDFVEFDIRVKPTYPFVDKFDSVSFKKDALLSLDGQFRIPDIGKSLKDYGPKDYKQLPAPLNVMEGGIESFLKATDSTQDEFVDLKNETKINLEGKDQAFKARIGLLVPFDIKKLSPGKIDVELFFDDVRLKLPRITKTVSPPQFKPDGRFQKKEPEKKETEKKGPPIPLTLDLSTSDKEPLSLVSNLLDEPLRLLLDIDMKDGNLEDGFVRILPLKTTVFKRPIIVQDMLVSFDYPKDPVLKGNVKFPLPEYKINMQIEGPTGSPEVIFSSDPPLPQSDIYAVLLFGRPMSDLPPEDQSSAQSIDKILSQGILSLSVLYFLAGSPVEYVGYDSESGQAKAQIGLGAKTSLTVGAGSGSKSTGVRRSLGGGWYLDTSVENQSEKTQGSPNNYGVLLEKIIAY